MPGRVSAFLLAALYLAACGDENATAPSPTPQASASACEQREFEGSTFTTCRYDRRRDEIALFLDGPRGPLRSFAALEQQLGARARHLRFAMNAGMYDEAGNPIGLYVQDGNQRHPINRQRGPGNFHMLPNGIFQVSEDGYVAVQKSEEYRPQFPPLYATQSGPMLVIDGHLHPAIQDNGPSLHVRNGVGVDSESTAWFVISDEAVSFGRMARLFRDVLHCPNALYLDGSVSSLWDRPGGRRDTNTELGPLVAIFEREGRR
ncbi:phosphodiester glycosidase family protein [Allosphingosinicella sp.]|uniref:phosphodiester glycosidase family protein n=1 Tax=Allosphingosinicella sp. TaxID=2823234 RepID=UPI003784E97A